MLHSQEYEELSGCAARTLRENQGSDILRRAGNRQSELLQIERRAGGQAMPAERYLGDVDPKILPVPERQP